MPIRHILDFSFPELQTYLSDNQEKTFRARQIFSWVYQRGVKSFSGMSDLPEALRKRLEKDFVFHLPVISEARESEDGTKKFLFEFADGEAVESVLIPARGRMTVCVSTQAGCRFGCRFCASGVRGWKRHLSAGEMLSQILVAQIVSKEQQGRLSHVVFMGTGEPLDNYDELIKSIRIINSPEGIGLAARHITVSTCGLIPEIKKLSREGLQLELSISLHGFDDASREQLMPVNKKYSFAHLMAACREYARQTRRQITFEYVLIQGVTCTPEAPRQLARALRGMLAKVNLIPYNPVREFSYRPPLHTEVIAFRQELIRQGIPATIRIPRGKDIGAACGQLRAGHAQRLS